MNVQSSCALSAKEKPDAALARIVDRRTRGDRGLRTGAERGALGAICRPRSRRSREWWSGWCRRRWSLTKVGEVGSGRRTSALVDLLHHDGRLELHQRAGQASLDEVLLLVEVDVEEVEQRHVAAVVRTDIVVAQVDDDAQNIGQFFHRLDGLNVLDASGPQPASACVAYRRRPSVSLARISLVRVGIVVKKVGMPVPR